MSITSDIQPMVIVAMKAGDTKRRDALRLILNALKTEAKNQCKTLSHEEEIEILAREAKKRREAIDGYKMVNNQERVDAETYELALIQSFMPTALTEEEVRNIARSLITQLGATSKKDTGKVMKALIPEIKDKFDGKEAKAIVDQMLS